MPYESEFITNVLNYVLADGFEASGETDVFNWLGEGKTIADMLGQEASDAFYTAERRDELHGFVHAFDLQELEYYLNDDDRNSAIVLRLRGRELLFVAGTREGTPAFMTDWFKRNRQNMVSAS